MSISPAKRQRERNRRERQRPARTTMPGVDAEIAGIVPGPQPAPEGT